MNSSWSTLMRTTVKFSNWRGWLDLLWPLLDHSNIHFQLVSNSFWQTGPTCALAVSDSICNDFNKNKLTLCFQLILKDLRMLELVLFRPWLLDQNYLHPQVVLKHSRLTVIRQWLNLSLSLFENSNTRIQPLTDALRSYRLTVTSF